MILNLFYFIITLVISYISLPYLSKTSISMHDIMNFFGIKNFEELLVDGTGTTEEEK